MGINKSQIKIHEEEIMSAAELPNTSATPLFQAQVEQPPDGKETSKTSEASKTVNAEITKTDGSKMKREFTMNPEIKDGTGVRGTGFDQKVQFFMTLPETGKTKINANIDNDSHGLRVAEKIINASSKDISAEEILDDQGRQISAEEILKEDVQERLSKDGKP